MTIAASGALALGTGAKTATVTSGPPNNWSNPPLAVVSDDTYASARGDNVEQAYSSFHFGIPNGSIIDGISVNIEAHSSDLDGGCDLAVKLYHGSGAGDFESRTVHLTNADQTFVLGSATDDWGRTWDPTQLADGAFKVVLRTEDPGSSCNDPSTTDSTATASVDAFDVTVTYRTIDQHQVNNAPLSKGVCDQADFNFVIDMSGSIGQQGGTPSNLADLKSTINGFVTAFQAGGDGVYSGTRFNGVSATKLTNGYVGDTAFHNVIDALSGPASTTPTALGITTGAANDTNDRAGVQNIMFVVTDGSPNVPGGNLSDPPTWLQAANAAISAADAARSAYIVKTVYVTAPGDPGDTTLPFSNPDGDAAWASTVISEIGGGSFLPANFGGFVDDLFQAIHCTPPSQTTISTQASGTVLVGGQVSDTATLAGGTGATGSITFDLYGPGDVVCATSIFNSVKPVTGNGDYTSASFTATAPGTYRWIASYSGDERNVGASGACNDANESVVVTAPQILTPDLDVTKLVATGGGSFGPTSAAQPGDVVHYQITISNSGDGAATAVPVSDNIDNILAHATYNGDCSNSCALAGSVLSWTIASISAGNNEVLTFSVTLNASFPDGTTHLPNVVVVTGPGSNCPAAQGDANCDTDTTVSKSLLTIAKTNDAPIETLDLPNGSTADLPTADEGTTVGFTLAYTFGGDPVSNGVITDVLPEGLQYTVGSASSNDEFSFNGYDALTRTLSWKASEGVTKDGSVTYSALVLPGANELSQPLTNTATIDSDQTEPDSDTSDVFVPVIPQGETNVPTPPPTDTVGSTETSNPGISLTLVLAVLGVLVLSLGILTPVRSPVRRRNRR